MNLQASSFIPGDFGLGGTPGTGWIYVIAFGGWIYNGILQPGSSPCPRSPVVITPTPQPTVLNPTVTPTLGTGDQDTISRVLNCEASGLAVSFNGIAHPIYNRMTSGVAEWANYRTALSIIQNTGVDCYTSNRYLKPEFAPIKESNEAASWLLGMSPSLPVDPLIGLRAYYWLGVGTPIDPNNLEPTFAEIVDNPTLYNYAACNVSETREVKLQRLRSRFVGIDPSNRALTTTYFSQNPLCDQ